uniref:CCHC-type domain-containing protein n=1 Tax=Trichogramma kaykai TaxID=54128 RepID=A0ABD2WYE3_9HYME
MQLDSGARADEILVDLGGSDPTYGQPIENPSNRSRSVRFQSPLLNDRPLDSCINASDIAQDELKDHLALIYRYATGANLRQNLNHPNDLRQCGYNSQSYDQRPSAYTSQADRGHTYARQSMNYPYDLRPCGYSRQSHDQRQSAYTSQADRDHFYARQNRYHLNDSRQCGYNSESYDERQSAYISQADRRYNAATRRDLDPSHIRRDANIDYLWGRTSHVPSSFRLFNDIVKQIPIFDGKPNTLKLFCTAVEEAVEQLPLFERKIVRALQSKLVGEAEDIVGKLVDYCSVDELLRDLRDRFVNRNVTDGLAMKLGNAKQQADDDVRKFGCTIRSLYDNAVAAYRQAPDISAFEREAAIYSLQDNVLDCFLLGLCEPLQTRVRFKNPRSLADAIETASEIERKSCYRSAVGSNIISVGLIGVPLHVEPSGNINASDEKRVVCQVCKKPGHSALDCFKIKRAMLRCEICNKRGHEASTCNSANDDSRNESSNSNQQRENDNTSGNSTSDNYNNRTISNFNNEPPSTQKNN